MSSVKCGGFCCEKFSTCWSPREWKRWAKAIRAGEPTWTADDGKVYAHPTNTEEILQIADMVIHIETRKQYSNKPDAESTLKYRYLYTCRNFNPFSRLCMAYESRPAMCSGYPENTPTKTCHIEGCLCK